MESHIVGDRPQLVWHAAPEEEERGAVLRGPGDLSAVAWARIGGRGHIDKEISDPTDEVARAHDGAKQHADFSFEVITGGPPGGLTKPALLPGLRTYRKRT
ncbi:hypothetical protein NDU88_004778 [Pleurodeles waltl]|uniref:Uncharacterized protein n=1 Tax=Pleurodeles waltl TaxID=8319 RepID=A0AAV7VH82_PLEWA|nr:hypothetical protein NDU88_004778 [Pleurodeles waltl]